MTERETIYVRPDEDIHSIIDGISQAEGGEVDIVVPSGARILQNIVDAYLLKDAVAQYGKSVRLVTSDVMGQTFAARAGIDTAQVGTDEAVGEGTRPTTAVLRPRSGVIADIIPKATLTMAQRKAPGAKHGTGKKTKTKKTETAPPRRPSAARGIRSKKSVRDSQFLRNYQQERRKNGGFEELQTARSGRGGFRTPRVSTGKIITGILILALLVAGTVFARVLPKAEVVLFPDRDNQSFTVEVLVDQGAGSVDLEQGVVPGELLIDEQAASGEFKATGAAELDNKARGTITVANEFSAKPQTFIPSRFKDEKTGLIFWTQENITVPGATIEDGRVVEPGTVNALVIAAEPGPEYAIGPSRFSMPALAGTERGNKIYAVSASAMSGGTEGTTAVVTGADVESAHASLRADLEPKIRELRISLPEGITVWEEAYNEEVAEKSSSKQPGEPGQSFTASIRIVGRAVAFREGDLAAIIDETILGQIDESKTILPKSKVITFLKPPVVDYAEGTVFATLNVSVDVINKINAESFRGAIINKDKEEIRRILNSYEGVQSAQVNLWPFWVNTVPDNRARVTVTIHGT